MKKNSFLFAIVAFFCLLFSVGCNPGKTAEGKPVMFDSIKVEEKYHLFNDQTKSHCELSITFVYPQQYEDPRVLESIQTIFRATFFGEEYASLSMKDAMDKYVNQYIAEYKVLEQDYDSTLKSLQIEESDHIPMYSYEQIKSNSIEFCERNVLSFLVNSWEYTGGAHGNGATTGYVIDLETGNLLTGEDIFIENTKPRITELIVKTLMEDYGVNSPDSLVQKGFFSVDGIGPNHNFIVDNSGITYYYNTYEIGPHSMGLVEVFLPYEKLSSYIKKTSPLAKFVKKS